MISNEYIGTPNLQSAFRHMKIDRSKEPMFFEELYHTKFICPIQIDTHNLPKNPDGSVVLGNNSPLSLVSINDSSGTPYLIAFTDQSELDKWNQGKYQQTIICTFNDYKSLLMSGNTPYQGVVINPFGGNIVLAKELFRGSNTSFHTAKSNETIMIGQPKDYPTSMIEKLKQYFRNSKLVETAYLLWVVRGQETGYLLVLETRASPQQFFPKVGELCKPYLRDKPLDIVLLKSTFTQNAVENQQPFYKA